MVLLLLQVNYWHLEKMLMKRRTLCIKVTCEHTALAKPLLFLSSSFPGSRRVNGGIWTRGESLKHILHQPTNSTLRPCIPKRKLWFGREWRQPVAWPWFTGGLRLPRVTNHNIMALWIQSKAQLQRMRKRDERESYAKWHTSSPEACAVSTAIGYLTLHEGN